MKLSFEHPQLAWTLAGASGVSVALYLIGTAAGGGVGYYYLVWNLFLAWLPLAFVLILLKILEKDLWSSWPALGLTFLWLIFLPNSFYLLSDFVHLGDVTGANLMYGIVMFGSFAFDGLVVGFASLLLVHRSLLARRHSPVLAWSLIVVVLALASWAIYLGRYMRLNSWDFITNFVALLFSLSDQVLHPSGYPEMAGISAGFFVLLATIYLVIWRLAGGAAGIISANEK